MKIIDAVNRFKVTNTFASPALLAAVARYGAGRVKMPTLKRVISAGAPVPASVMEKFLSMLEPDARIITPYGATEALPVSAIDSREILGETRKMTDSGKGVCVGRAARDTTISIVPIDAHR